MVGGIQEQVLVGKRLGTAEHDAVDDNQRDEDAQTGGERRHEALDEKVHHTHEGGDDDDITRDAHLVGNHILQERDDDVGHQEHKRGGGAHTDGVVHRSGDRQRGTRNKVIKPISASYVHVFFFFFFKQEIRLANLSFKSHLSNFMFLMPQVT